MKPLTCREQWHNKISNIAASTVYCLKPTYGPYGILFSWNFLFDGGEQKLNPFQTNCHFRATPNSVVKGTAKATCTNEHKRSPPPQLTVKANTTVDLRLPICPGTLHKSCWEKTSCDLQWIWSGINRSLIFLWFSICLYYEVKFTSLIWNNLKTYCRFEVTSRDITKYQSESGLIGIAIFGGPKTSRKENINKIHPKSSAQTPNATKRPTRWAPT